MTDPDHDNLATFRRRSLDELSDLFVQIREMAKEMKLLKLGNVCLDGTKIQANASRRSALSHGHIEKREAQIKAEVQELFALAEQGIKPTFLTVSAFRTKSSAVKIGWRQWPWPKRRWLTEPRSTIKEREPSTTRRWRGG